MKNDENFWISKEEWSELGAEQAIIKKLGAQSR